MINHFLNIVRHLSVDSYLASASGESLFLLKVCFELASRNTSAKTMLSLLTSAARFVRVNLSRVKTIFISELPANTWVSKPKAAMLGAE